jgi:outer membrane receptor protein involved in Fe transport
MKNILNSTFLCLVVALFSLSAVHAQSTVGSVTGTVAGASAGTVVVAVDEARNIERSVSAANGSFEIDDLVPGDWTIQVRNGNAIVDSVSIEVRVGSTSNVALAATDALVEEILVTGQRLQPLDAGIAESGIVVTADEIDALPVGRGLNSVALLTAGAISGDRSFGGVSFSGSSVAENQVYINGLNTTNFRTGIGFGYVPFEFLEQVQTKSGGYGAQYGRSIGGVINAVTRSGSNDFRFGVNVNNSFNQSTSPNTYAALNELYDSNSTTQDFWVSGPILRDRLFYYAFQQNWVAETDAFSALSDQMWASRDDNAFTGYKIDAYITDNQRLEYTYWDAFNRNDYGNYAFDRATRNIGAFTGTTIYESGGENEVFSYTGEFGPLTIKYLKGTNNEARSGLPTTSDVSPIYAFEEGSYYKVTQFSASSITQADDVREMDRFDITLDLGNHQLLFGTESEDLTAIQARRYSGSGNYWYLDVDQTSGITTWMHYCDETTGGTAGVDTLDPYELSNQGFVCSTDPKWTSIANEFTYIAGGTFETKNSAWYLVDTFDIGENLTIEAGIRSSDYENFNSAGELFISAYDQVAPRLAFVYDAGPDAKVYGSYGQYYMPVATNTNIRYAGGEYYVDSYYQWTGNVSAVTDSGPPASDLNFLFTDTYADGSVPDSREALDATIKPMYQTEYILGAERVLDSGWIAGLKGIYRSLDVTIEDILIDEGMWNHFAGTEYEEDILAYYSGSHYVMTNPGTDVVVYDPVSEQTVTITAAETNIPAPERVYKALEFTLEKPWDGRSSTNLSYTLGSSYGNFEGWVRSDNGQDDAGLTSLFDSGSMTAGSEGYLPNDRRHILKLWGNRMLTDNLLVGYNATYMTGRPLSCFGNDPDDVLAYTNSAFWCNGAANNRGDAGRLPNQLDIDVNAQYTINIANNEVILTATIYNLLDAKRVNESVEQADGYYGLPTSYQSPRAVRFGFRYNFN